MKYNPAIHHRRSIRLKGYDYASPGAYFVTICTHHRDYFFGDIHHRAMTLTPYGDACMHAHCHKPNGTPFLPVSPM